MTDVDEVLARVERLIEVQAPSRPVWGPGSPSSATATPPSVNLPASGPDSRMASSPDSDASTAREAPRRNRPPRTP